jgi:hypothetical protein
MVIVIRVCVSKHNFQHNNIADLDGFVVAMICNDKLCLPIIQNVCGNIISTNYKECHKPLSVIHFYDPCTEIYIQCHKTGYLKFGLR